MRTAPSSVLLAGICTAVAAAALSCCAPGTSSPERPGAPQGVAGFEWTVTGISDHYGTLAVAPGTANLAFARDGYLSGSDGCNGFDAQYQFLGDGYSTSRQSQTLVLCSGRPVSDLARTQKAVDAVAGLVTALDTADDPQVRIDLAGDTASLTNTSDHITVTVKQAGQTPDRSTERVSSSAVIGTASASA